jgi:hypothetical protein
MLDAVRDQSERFWSDRQFHAPDWWERLPLIPFRELCAEELSQVGILQRVHCEYAETHAPPTSVAFSYCESCCR